MNINAQPVVCLVDTGASHTYISTTLVKSLNLNVVEHTPVSVILPNKESVVSTSTAVARISFVDSIACEIKFQILNIS